MIEASQSFDQTCYEHQPSGSNVDKSGLLTSSSEEDESSAPSTLQETAPSTPRPPLARRSMTLQDPRRQNCPAPPPLQRGLSYQTSSSRHSRHNANELPKLKQVFLNQSTPNIAMAASDSHVPLEVSMRPRLVSALEDDEDAFGEWRDSVFQEEEDKEANNFSPVCVIKETVALPSSDLWVQSWVSPHTNGDDDSFIGEDDDNDSIVIIDDEEEEASPSDDAGLSFLPTTPAPKAAAHDDGVVFTCGWAAVLLNNDLSAVHAANYDSDDDIEGASVLPTIQKSAIHYVQLLQTGHLQLVSLENQEQQQAQKVKIESSTMRLEYVSKRVGHCLVLQGEEFQSIALLPVNLPASYLTNVGKSKRRAQAPPRFFAPFSDKEEEDRYAPYAQHAAIMHIRFGMDAALRAAVQR